MGARNFGGRLSVRSVALTLAIIMIFLFRTPLEVRAQFSVLHTFVGGPFNTVYVFSGAGASLASSGSTLYGVARMGGTHNCGSIFKMNADGAGYQVLHDFAGNADGECPCAPLTLSGSTLYGTTETGGVHGCGTIFRIDIDGTGYRVLYSFTGNNDGIYPVASLTLSGSTLYGTTSGRPGGYGNGYGTVFKINTDGTGFQLLYVFTGYGGDGAYPLSAPTLSGTTLYGTTKEGGSDNFGTIYKVGTDGTGYQVLHSFSESESVKDPHGSLILSGSTLYGTAASGGTYYSGGVFKMSTDGSGFQVLYSFSGGADGAGPYPSLTLSGAMLYGTTSGGGAYGYGTVFSIHTDGTGLQVLHSFSGQGDGIFPSSQLTLSGSTLYGTTSYEATSGGIDGKAYGYGTAFKINSDGTGFAVLRTFTDGADAADPHGSLTLSGATLYGTTTAGGETNNNGAVYKMNTDGTGFQVLYSFTGGADGDFPVASLILSGSTLYGTAEFGGAYNCGTVFKINTDGTGFQVLHTFTGGADGNWPVAALTLSGSSLYGTNRDGGEYGYGVLFKIDTSGAGFEVLHAFTRGADGARPYGSVTLSGSTLYGTATVGGTDDHGTVFKVGTDGADFQVLHSFTGWDGDGPFASLTLSGAMLYGITVRGGIGYGTVFKINTDGTGFEVLHVMGTDAHTSYNSLALSGSTLYGTGYGGGPYGYGAAFKINTDGTGYQVIYGFTGGADGALPGAPILSGATLYGTTGSSAAGCGTVYSLGLSPVSPKSFAVLPPASATAGTPAGFAVTALDTNDNQVTSYSGTVHFTSTDSKATLPADTLLTNGTGTFPATFNTAGNQIIAAADTANSGLTGISSAITVVPANNTLTVSISPQGAIESGAKWNIDGGGWNVSGAIIYDLTAGPHTVGFSAIAGWNTPVNQTAAISRGAAISLTGTYVEQTNGVCGSSNGGIFTSAPTNNLCNVGTLTTVSGSGPWNWTCTGKNGGTNASCSAYIPAGSGECGSSNGEGFLKAPRSNLCSAGRASKVTGKGPFVWTCVGSSGGITASCSANLKVNGACGSSDGKVFFTVPSSNLCKSGAASSITGAGPWGWTCQGANGGTNESCSAKLKLNGACGSANKGNFFTQPEAGLLCSAGTASLVTGKGPWKWKCAGSNGGKSASCSANLEVNGACGGSNGMTLTKAPKSSLCNAGKASKVTGNGPWNWSCAGSNGGTTDSCSADIQ